MDLSRWFPGMALKRARQRVELARLERAFDAAKTTQWRKQPVITESGQTAVATGGAKMRAWARHLDENHDLTIGILDNLVNNVVGTGLTCTPMVRRQNGNLAASINTAITELWNDWVKRPEVTGQYTFSEVQRLACRGWLRDGEILAQHVQGDRSDLDHLTNVPYSIEMIEPDFLPFDLIQGDNITSGILTDSWGRPVAYYLLKAHPGTYNGTNIGILQETKAMPADVMLHVKFVRRFHQVRGQSALHGVITRMDDIKEYEESERIAARVAAAFTGYVKKSTDFATASNSAGDRTFEMSPGMVFDNLMPGEEIGTIESNRPNTGLNDFRNGMLRAVAAGTGTSYSSVSKDYSGTYSSQRQEMVESSTGYKRMREYFVAAFVQPIYERFIQTAQIAGQLAIPGNLDATAVEFSGITLPWIDPKKEVEADTLAVESGFKSRHQVIRERGGDPRIVDDQRKQDTMPGKAQEPETENPAEPVADKQDDEVAA